MPNSVKQTVVKKENLDPTISKIIESVLKIDEPTAYNDYEIIGKVLFEALNFSPLYIHNLYLALFVLGYLHTKKILNLTLLIFGDQYELLII